MTDVSIRELRNHGGDVVDRAQRAEQIMITRLPAALRAHDHRARLRRDDRRNRDRHRPARIGNPAEFRGLDVVAVPVPETA